MLLCLAAGRLDWRQCLSELSSTELAEWESLLQRQPIGGRQEDLRAGMLIAAVLNSNPYRKGSVDPASLFPSLRDLKKNPAARQITDPKVAASYARMITERMGGEIREK